MNQKTKDDEYSQSLHDLIDKIQMRLVEKDPLIAVNALCMLIAHAIRQTDNPKAARYAVFDFIDERCGFFEVDDKDKLNEPHNIV